MELLYGDSVIRIRAELITDRYGNTTTVRDWDNAERVEIDGVSVQPGETVEFTGDRNTIDSLWRVITPRGRDADVERTDRMEVHGVLMEVDGDVARYTLGGRIHHAEIRLRRLEG